MSTNSRFLGDRVSAKLGDVEFDYQYPFLSVDTATNTTDHALLQPDEGELTEGVEQRSSVLQYTGSELAKYTLRGHCYLDEGASIDTMDDGRTRVLRHERLQSTDFVIVQKSTTNPRGSGGGPREDVRERIYDYRIEMIRAPNNAVSGEDAENAVREAFPDLDEQLQEATDENGNT